MGWSPDRGPTVSHYRLVSKLGEGGMGVVWRAEDISLRRPVALKFLTAASLTRPDRKIRFLREARLAAALNHPAICTIHEVGEVGESEGGHGFLPAGTPFIAMELVEGTSLAEHLKKTGSLPLAQALDIAQQIAEGLVEAHARGIVHRDLKPGNVMLDRAGRAKILDFGLAKPLAPAERDDAVMSDAQTISEELTSEGLVVGTAAYMSPEQAKGDSLDSRSDVFSLGIVLYEMVAGQRPFRGDSASATRRRIVDADPEPIPEGGPEIPERLEEILLRCLSKDPDDRYNDTRDLVVALRSLRQESSSGRQRRLVTSSSGSAVAEGAGRKGRAPARSRQPLPWILGAALVLLAVAILLYWPRPPAEPSRQAERVTVVLPTDIELIKYSEITHPVSLAPDGRTLLFAGRPVGSEGERGSPRLYMRRLDSFEPVAVPGTDGFQSLAISPDGKWGATSVPVQSGRPDRDLARLSLTGGSSPVRIARWPLVTTPALTCLPDEALLYRTEDPLMLHRLTAEGKSEPDVAIQGLTEIPKVAEAWLGDPLPDGRHLFLHHQWQRWGAGRLVTDLLLLDALTGETRLLMRRAYPAHLLARDILLFSREQTLLAVKFDPDRLELVGTPVPVLEGLPGISLMEHGQFASSGNGTVAYPLVDPEQNDFQIRTLSRDGIISPWDGQARIYHVFVLSPDGKRVAASAFPDLTGPPMIAEVDRRQFGALAKGPEEGDCYSAAFSPDGKLLAYRCNQGISKGRSGGIYLRSAGGVGIAEKILDLADNAINLASSIVFSADSSRMIIRRRTSEPNPWLSLPLPPGEADPENLEIFLPADVDAQHLQFSPDGAFIVYASERGGVPTVYARALSPGGEMGEEVRLSPGIGRLPRLRTGPPRPEQEVVYMSRGTTSGSEHLVSVRVRTGNGLTVSEPTAIAGGSVDEMRLMVPRYAVLPDARIMFVQEPPEPEGPDRIQVILNFDVEVRRRLEEMESGGTP